MSVGEDFATFRDNYQITRKSATNPERPPKR
jgi:hypothetical protein